MTRVYVSARWEDRERAKAVQERLRHAGFVAVSTWMFEPADNSMAGLRSSPEQARAVGVRDLEQIDECDMLVCLVPPLDIPWRGTGGRHVELGYALAREKMCVVVGDRENVFHFDARIIHYPTEADFLDVFTGAYWNV